MFHPLAFSRLPCQGSFVEYLIALGLLWFSRLLLSALFIIKLASICVILEKYHIFLSPYFVKKRKYSPSLMVIGQGSQGRACLYNSVFVKGYQPIIIAMYTDECCTYVRGLSVVNHKQSTRCTTGHFLLGMLFFVYYICFWRCNSTCWNLI